jgi:hypothetical protein
MDAQDAGQFDAVENSLKIEESTDNHPHGSLAGHSPDAIDLTVCTPPRSVIDLTMTTPPEDMARHCARSIIFLQQGAPG